MNGTSSTASLASSKLGDLLARLPLNQPDQWDEIEATAQSLANDLRIRDVEQQTTLGKTLLPQTLTSLLKGAVDGAPIPATPQKQAIFELLRVGANLCMDHDDNRSYLEEAGFLQSVVSLLEGYADQVVPDNFDPLPLSLVDLKIVRTAIGVLLNASIGFEPVKSKLVSLEAPFAMLRLAGGIYPPGSWLHFQPPTTNGQPSSSSVESVETWTTRVTLSQWAWRAISELSEDSDEKPRLMFTTDALPYLVRNLRAFIPPYSAVPNGFDSNLRRTFIKADYDALEESCGMLESLAMDDEEIRLSLARGLAFPSEHGGIPCLSDMLAFVDRGDYPPHWAEDPAEAVSRQKGFDHCKAAIIKSIVELAGDEKNLDVLWDDSDPAKPGGEFVDTMVQWIRKHKSLRETGRDDLIVCATLSLGNLVRRDAHSLAITGEPIALAPELATLLSPEIDLKVKHGVIALLKHLAQAGGNRTVLGKAGIAQRLSTSGVFGEKADVIDIVQLSAIGVVKHMCNGNLENTLALVLPDPKAPLQPTALSQIIALAQRSDSIAVKSEGTRVLVNAIKSVWSNDATHKDAAVSPRRTAAMDLLATPAHAAALAQLIGRSRRYPILINEGVVALTLLSTHNNGGLVAIDAILNPLPSEHPGRGVPISAGPSAAIDSPAATGGPRRALDMLVTALRNADGKMPMEVRANVCALVGHLGRPGVVASSRAQDVHVMKETLRELLGFAKEERGHVGHAAKKALDAWAD